MTKHCLIATAKKYKNIFQTFTEELGIILLLAEGESIFFTSKYIYNGLHEWAWLVIIVCLIIAMGTNWEKLEYHSFLADTDEKIEIHVMNILDADAAIVIPTNTTFDTKMEGEFISIGSVQGQFQEKYFKNNLEELDRLLEEGLKNYIYEEIDKTNGKNHRYPLGTVSKVTYVGKHFYFVAIANINEYGKPINPKSENIQMALQGVWKCLENKGHIENLAIPIIGTGKAGIKNISRNFVIKEIVSSFVESASKRKIADNLLICVHPRDLAHKDLNLQDISEYLKFMCKYRCINKAGIRD